MKMMTRRRMMTRMMTRRRMMMKMMTTTPEEEGEREGATWT
jgi:hypothetical protein